MVFIILVLLILLGMIAYRGFTVEKVEVEGTDLYTQETIKQWILNDDYSWNSLYVFFKYKFKKAEEMPFLQEPVVTLKSPRVLHIQVKEKEVFGYLYLPSVGQNAYFDENGVVVETSSEKIEGIMEVTGFECEKATLHKKIPIKDKSMLKSILNLTQGLSKYDMLPEAMNCSEYSNIVLEYGNITVNFGNSQNLKPKIQTLAAIFPKIEKKRGTIHIENWSEENTDVSFEEARDR